MAKRVILLSIDSLSLSLLIIMGVLGPFCKAPKPASAALPRLLATEPPVLRLAPLTPSLFSFFSPMTVL